MHKKPQQCWLERRQKLVVLHSDRNWCLPIYYATYLLFRTWKRKLLTRRHIFHRITNEKQALHCHAGGRSDTISRIKVSEKSDTIHVIKYWKLLPCCCVVKLSSVLFVKKKNRAEKKSPIIQPLCLDCSGSGEEGNLLLIMRNNTKRLNKWEHAR